MTLGQVETSRKWNVLFYLGSVFFFSQSSSYSPVLLQRLKIFSIYTDMIIKGASNVDLTHLLYVKQSFIFF